MGEYCYDPPQSKTQNKREKVDQEELKATDARADNNEWKERKKERTRVDVRRNKRKGSNKKKKRVHRRENDSVSESG